MADGERYTDGGRLREQWGEAYVDEIDDGTLRIDGVRGRVEMSIAMWNRLVDDAVRSHRPRTFSDDEPWVRIMDRKHASLLETGEYPRDDRTTRQGEGA